MISVRIVGPGRAGQSFARAIDGIDGWTVVGLLGRDDPVKEAASDVDLVMIATPDAQVSRVAAAIDPGRAVVAHVAGSLGLDVLAPHEHRAGVHPLVSLPSGEVGAESLRGAWFAVAGHDIVTELVGSLKGHTFRVADDKRALYHAAAAVSSNHLVALLGHAQRLGAAAGVPPEALMVMSVGSVRNAAAMGPGPALTGPAARGDEGTIMAHLKAIAEFCPEELDAYEAMLAEARRLASQKDSGHG